MVTLSTIYWARSTADPHLGGCHLPMFRATQLKSSVVIVVLIYGTRWNVDEETQIQRTRNFPQVLSAFQPFSPGTHSGFWWLSDCPTKATVPCLMAT